MACWVVKSSKDKKKIIEMENTHSVWYDAIAKTGKGRANSLHVSGSGIIGAPEHDGLAEGTRYYKDMPMRNWCNSLHYDCVYKTSLQEGADQHNPKRCLHIVPKKLCRRAFHCTAQKAFMIPSVIEKESNGLFQRDIFSKLLQERIICIMEPVSDYLAGIVIAQLLHLQSSDAKKPIDIYINCQGGIVSSTLAIYDTMQFLKPPISTWCVGQANSMGSLLLTAGSPGMRLALPHSRMMLNQPMGVLGGQTSDVEIQAEEITKLLDEVNGIYAKHTNKSPQEIDEIVKRRKYLSAQEAKDFGLIDRVLEFPSKH